MTTPNALREEYQLYRHAAWEQAERDCNGYLLSKEGRRAGIDPERLWEIPEEKAVRYASPELLDWWGIGDCRAGGPEHGRLTWEDYREQALREMPLAEVEALARPVTYHWARVEIHIPGQPPETVTCRCVYGHERPDLALQHARKIAAQRGVPVAA